MIQDLHSHTYYSFCGADTPDAVVEAAIRGGVELLGITDHNYGIALHRPDTEFKDEYARVCDYQRSLNAYLAHMRRVSAQYADKLTILCGVEIATLKEKWLRLPDGVDISGFDYCLVEHIHHADTMAPDLFAFAARCCCGRVGIAHTDLFGFLKSTGKEPEDYFRRMAQAGIFWELNVNYDSIHGYHEHAYVREFLNDAEKQEIVCRSGVEVSVGFDGHRVGDYAPERIHDACRKLETLGIRQAFSQSTP